MRRGRLALLAMILLGVWFASVLCASASPMPHEWKNIGLDGWDDAAVLYNYGGGKVAYFAFESSVTSGGNALTVPRKLWQSTSGWDGTKVTPLVGDVTGDARADVISAYAYNSSTTGLLVTPGSGTTSASYLWWKSAAWVPGKTKWTTARMVNGAPLYSPIALYDYGNSTSAVWQFGVGGKSTFVPSRIWKSSAGGWSWAKSKVAGGDFNADGKGDLAILYDYGNNRTGLWLFVSDGTGYVKARVWLSAPGGWSWARSRLQVADVDGDAQTEPVVIYSRANDTKFFVFQPNASATAATVHNWGTSVYTFFDDIPTTLLDLNHDWKADIVMWGAGDSDYGASMEMLPSKGTSFETELLEEVFNDSDPAHWNYLRTKLAH